MNHGNIKKKYRIIRAFAMLLLIATVGILIKIAVDRAGGERQTIGAITVSSYSDVSASSADEDAAVSQKPDSLTVTMAGDCLLHEGLRDNALCEDGAFDFSHQIELMEGTFCADLNIVNMENPINAYGGNKRLHGYPCFNAPDEFAAAIAGMGVDVGITANNHCLDNGIDGLINNLGNIRKYGIDTVGTYASQKERDTPYICNINGIKVGIVAFTESTNGIKLEDSCERFAVCRLDSADTVLSEVEKLREQGAECIIAAVHWGEEYTNEPLPPETELAQHLCEGGVDIIMGSHPHVVQPIERLRVQRADGVEHECLVIYSLGNFYACQGSRGSSTRRSITVSVRLERGEDNIVRITDAFYMPVMMFSSSKDSSIVRLIPEGRYIDGKAGAELPDFIGKDDIEDYCKPAWNHVVETAGSEIPVVRAPEEYPDWMIDND